METFLEVESVKTARYIWYTSNQCLFWECYHPVTIVDTLVQKSQSEWVLNWSLYLKYCIIYCDCTLTNLATGIKCNCQIDIETDCLFNITYKWVKSSWENPKLRPSGIDGEIVRSIWLVQGLRFSCKDWTFEV